MKYIVTHNIDYLAFSTHAPHEFFDDKKYDNIKSPNSHYDSAIVNDSGALHLWHSRNPKMKHHYIYSAQPLAYLRERGFDERAMVATCLEKSTISRIDIAITSQLEDGATHTFTPHDLAIAIHANKLKSRMATAKDIADDLRIQTKYIGNRKTRSRLFRAYDKGIDNDTLANVLIRYELETRKGTKTIARAIVKNENYAAIIRRYVDFPSIPAWLEIMNTPPAKMSHSTPVLSAREMDEKKSLSRWQWLQDSIPRTVEKALQEDYDKFGIYPDENPEFQKFLRTIMYKMSGITKKLDMP